MYRAFTQAHSRAPALAAARASARVPAFAPRLGAVAHGGVRRGVQFRRVATAATAKKVNPISAWGKRHPFWFQMIFCTAQAGASDFLIQKYVEKRKNIDLERNAVFVCEQSCAQHRAMNVLTCVICVCVRVCVWSPLADCVRCCVPGRVSGMPAFPRCCCGAVVSPWLFRVTVNIVPVV